MRQANYGQPQQPNSNENNNSGYHQGGKAQKKRRSRQVDYTDGAYETAEEQENNKNDVLSLMKKPRLS